MATNSFRFASAKHPCILKAQEVSLHIAAWSELSKHAKILDPPLEFQAWPLPVVHNEGGRLHRPDSFAINSEILQDHKPWALKKGGEAEVAACGTVINASLGVVLLLAGLVEPYMPSITTKVWSSKIEHLKYIRRMSRKDWSRCLHDRLKW